MTAGAEAEHCALKQIPTEPDLDVSVDRTKQAAKLNTNQGNPVGGKKDGTHELGSSENRSLGLE